MIETNAFISQFPGFTLGLGDGEVAALMEALEMEELSAGETLLVAGTPSDALFLVWNGSLEVLLAGTDDEVVARIGPGDVLGEVSLMDPGPASATVRCDTGAVLLVLTRERLEELWEEHPRVASRLLTHLARTLAERIRKTMIKANRAKASTVAADAGTLFVGGPA